MTLADSAQQAETAGDIEQEFQDPQLILWTGLALGVAADLLVWAQGPAVTGFFVWVVLIATSICYLTRLKKTSNLPHVLVWSAVACLAAFLMILRSAEVLIPAMWLLMLTAATLISGKYLQPRLTNWRVTELIQSVFMTLFYTGFGIIPLLAKLRLSGITDNPRNQALLRALIILVPLLLVFLMLFASADALVNRLTDDLLSWLTEDIVSHTFRIVSFAWVSTGLLRVMSHSMITPPPQPDFKTRLGTLEINVVLGGLAVLFVAFVLLQLGYLFGGSSTIQSTSGLTVAEYARRGFFELVVVAGLTLSVLLGLYPLSSDQSRFRMLAFILVLCVLIMQISAAQRLWYYISEFGLSLDRVIATTVMIWLACVLLAFAGTVLRGEIKGFVYGSVIAGVITVFVCALLNPVALVGRVNIERSASQGKALDVQYLLELGPDIVPTLLDRLDEMPASAQCLTAMQLSKTILPVERDDWRRFHLGDRRANERIQVHRNQLEGINRSVLGSAFAIFQQTETNWEAYLALCGNRDS